MPGGLPLGWRLDVLPFYTFVSYFGIQLELATRLKESKGVGSNHHFPSMKIFSLKCSDHSAITYIVRNCDFWNAADMNHLKYSPISKEIRKFRN